MPDQDELGTVRRAYAKRIMAAAEADDQRVETAFAMVRREDFLGRGPWPVVRRGRGYVPTPSDDPAFLYDDVLVGILPERGINNGQPSLHARLIAAACPREGEHAVHIGAGVGYYTAILAHLVGSSGRVTAIELDPDLAARATINLASFAQVAVIEGNGATAAFDAADVIYVSAGATRPADTWLDGLAEGGRLIVPLTTSDEASGRFGAHGAVFRIERRGAEFLAEHLSGVAIVPCAGARDAKSEAALTAAFRRGGWERVTRLYRSGDVPKGRCWLRAPDWCLAYS